MSELETLSRALFERTDGTVTMDFKVFLGSNRDVHIEDLCAEINKVFAQERNGLVRAEPSLDGHLVKVRIDDFLSKF